MGGVIGATSGKFVLVAATLLLHGRVDGMSAHIAIVPGARTSAISTDLQARTAPQRHNRDATIGLRAETFQARLDRQEATPAPGADLRIGQDVLDEQPIEIDFKHHEIQPLSSREAQRIERTARVVPVRRDADETLWVELAVGVGPSMKAKLDLTSTTGVTVAGAASDMTVRIGTAKLSDVNVTAGSEPVVGLYAFKSSRVIFDLGHDRIWIAS